MISLKCLPLLGIVLEQGARLDRTNVEHDQSSTVIRCADYVPATRASHRVNSSVSEFIINMMTSCFLEKLA